MRKFFSGITFSLFTILVIPLLFVFAFSRTYFSEDFYRGPFVDRLQHLTEDVLVTQIISSGESFHVVFSETDIQKIISESFDRSFFEKIVYRFVDQFHVLNQEHFNIQLDFQEIREPLRQFFSRIAGLVLASRPVCTIDEIPKNEGIIPSCIPQEWKTPAFEEKFHAQLDKAFEENLFRHFESRNGFPAGKIDISFKENINQIEQIKNISSFLPFLALGFLFFLGFFAFFIYGKPISSAFFYLSKMLFISSLLLAISGFLFSSIPTYLKQEYFSAEFSSFFETFRSSLIFLLQPFSSEFFLYTAVLFALSALFYFLGRSKIDA